MSIICDSSRLWVTLVPKTKHINVWNLEYSYSVDDQPMYGWSGVVVSALASINALIYVGPG